MIGRLVPESMEGRMMGLWHLFSGTAVTLSSLLSQMEFIPLKVTPLPAANLIYQQAFFRLGGTALLFGIIAFYLVPSLTNKIGERSTLSSHLT
tara:strand:- start:1189 stop:1467 length:279 start_codon:yes stop_codon:yes gene_type:complete